MRLLRPSPAPPDSARSQTRPPRLLLPGHSVFRGQNRCPFVPSSLRVLVFFWFGFRVFALPSFRVLSGHTRQKRRRSAPGARTHGGASQSRVKMHQPSRPGRSEARTSETRPSLASRTSGNRTATTPLYATPIFRYQRPGPGLLRLLRSGTAIQFLAVIQFSSLCSCSQRLRCLSPLFNSTAIQFCQYALLPLRETLFSCSDPASGSPLPVVLFFS